MPSTIAILIAPTLGLLLPIGASAESRVPKTVALISSMQCRCSPDQLEAFAAVAAEYGPRGLLFRIVEAPLGGPLQARTQAKGEKAPTAELAREYYEHFGLKLPISIDAEEAERVGAQKAPTAAILDGEGRPIFVGSILGQNEEPILKPALDALLAGKDPDAKLVALSRKRFGCAIRSGVVKPHDGKSAAKP